MLAALPSPPRTFIVPTALGDHGGAVDVALDDSVALAADDHTGFGPAQEAAAEPARAAGIRVVHPRIGVVLTPAGGALPRIVPWFRLGLGGLAGEGRSVNWIALDDVLGAVLCCLTDESLHGPVDLVAPASTSSREFAWALGAVLHRPAIVPWPASAARIVLGAAGEGARRTSTVAPSALERAGFRFAYPKLEGALRHVFGRCVP